MRVKVVLLPISIHALLAESDYDRRDTMAQELAISIHALLAESDGQSGSRGGLCRKFLSTLSLRRATVFLRMEGGSLAISIHALLAESDHREK